MAMTLVEIRAAGRERGRMVGGRMMALDYANNPVLLRFVEDCAAGRIDRGYCDLYGEAVFNTTSAHLIYGVTYEEVRRCRES